MDIEELSRYCAFQVLGIGKIRFFGWMGWWIYVVGGGRGDGGGGVVVGSWWWVVQPFGMGRKPRSTQ